MIINIHFHFAANVIPTARKGIRVRVLGDLVGTGGLGRAVLVYVRNVARRIRRGRRLWQNGENHHERHHKYERRCQKDFRRFIHLCLSHKNFSLCLIFLECLITYVRKL